MTDVCSSSDTVVVGGLVLGVDYTLADCSSTGFEMILGHGATWGTAGYTLTMTSLMGTTVSVTIATLVSAYEGRVLPDQRTILQSATQLSIDLQGACSQHVLEVIQ